MEKTMTITSRSRLAWVAVEHSAHTAPDPSVQGTGVSFAGTSAVVLRRSALDVVLTAPVAASVTFVGGARTTDLPGLPPRGAPV